MPQLLLQITFSIVFAFRTIYTYSNGDLSKHQYTWNNRTKLLYINTLKKNVSIIRHFCLYYSKRMISQILALKIFIQTWNTHRNMATRECSMNRNANKNIQHLWHIISKYNIVFYQKKKKNWKILYSDLMRTADRESQHATQRYNVLKSSVKIAER